MKQPKKSKTWQYGRDPAPTNWHLAADALSSIHGAKKANPVVDKLDTIAKLLKDKK